MGQRTQEDIADRGFTCFTICEPGFVGLETRKSKCHLWYDAGEDSAKTLVQREWRLAPHNHDASGYEAARFGLYEDMQHIRQRALRTTMRGHVPLVHVQIWRAACALLSYPVVGSTTMTWR